VLANTRVPSNLGVDLCDENERIETLDTPSEGRDMGTCGIQEDNTSYHEEDVAS
jgi:hypothetical protein